MNPLTIIGLIPTILRIVEFVRSTLAQGLSINSVGTIVENQDVKSIFATLGELLFPKAHADLQPSAAIVATYAPDYVKKVQNSLNVILKLSPPLDVDGHYGAKTRDAAEQYQKSKGLVVDGFIGDNSMAMIAADIAKHDADAKAAIQAAVPSPEIQKT